MLLVPLVSWAAPANRGDALFLFPSLQRVSKRFQWLPRWTVGDMAYVGLKTQRRIREELGVAFITRLRPDMHLVSPYSGPGTGIPRCPQGQRLQWLGAAAEAQQQWFGAAHPQETCAWCWQRSSCAQEFAYAASDHEILLGAVPQASWLAQTLLTKVRPWIEPAQAFEKNRLGLSAFFLNSLHLTWVMSLLADAVVLMRAKALLLAPQTQQPLAHLTPKQTCFDWRWFA